MQMGEIISQLPPIALALSGSLLPIGVWLWFWLREDRKHPEPRNLIALAFLMGALTVAAVIPLQKFTAGYFALTGTLMFAVWALIEEASKYFAARFSVLWRRENDEPIDSVIYLVTIALGFAAVENALFLLNPSISGHIMTTILTSDLRSIGATLLHVLSSSVIGVMIALSWYKTKMVKILYAVAGVILATLLHAGFNFLILNTKDTYLFHAFGFVWVGIIVLLGVLEYVKRMHRPTISRKTTRS